MKRFGMLTTLFSAVMLIVCLLYTAPALAISDDSIMSQHVMEADGTSGQDTNSGSGIKTGHIQDSAVTTGKIADGAVTSAKISGPLLASSVATYQNELVVHKADADGVHTFNTINAALASITNATASNRYRITVKPGVYDESILMKAYVDIVGSGRENTKLTSSSGTTIEWYENNATLSGLTVENNSGAWEVIYIYASAVIRDVTVIVPDQRGDGIDGWGSLEIYDSKILLNAGLGTGNFGIDFDGSLLVSGCRIEMHSVSGGWAIGLYLYGSGEATVEDTTIYLTGDRSDYGIMGGNVKVRNSRVIIESTSTTDENIGIAAESGGPITLLNSEVSVTSQLPSWTSGVRAWNTYVSVVGSSIASSGLGIYLNGSSASVEANNSVISGDTNGVYKNGTGSFKIGNCQIKGGHNGVAGVDKIVNCHDGSYTSIPNL